MFVYMNKLACTCMCDTCGLITANSTCPFGASWAQLYVCPAVDHVSSNGGHCAPDPERWMMAANCSSRPCSPDVYTVRVHVRVRAIRMYRSMCDAICSHSLVCKSRSDEETSVGLHGQDVNRSLSVDGEAVPGGKKAPT